MKFVFSSCDGCRKSFKAVKQYGRSKEYSRFCSQECSRNFLVSKICLRCNGSFEGSARRKFCKKCRSTLEKKCENCKSDFRTKNKNGKFCSMHCFSEWSKGRINKEPKAIETKKRISLKMKGVPRGPMDAKHRSSISKSKKGKKFSEQHVRNMSVSAVRRIESGKFGGKQEIYFSEKTGEKNYSHSKFELELMKLFDIDDSILAWTKNHGIKIPYRYLHRNHLYVPDFLVTRKNGTVELVEAKGFEYEPERCRAKETAAQKYCVLNRLVYRCIYQCRVT